LKYKIEINREGCIACGTCYALDQAHFEPGAESKSKVIGGTSNGKSEGKFDDDKIKDAQEAEQSCPVSVIKVTLLKRIASLS
jgi:ferredoxin